jgi:hypothetical protein
MGKNEFSNPYLRMLASTSKQPSTILNGIHQGNAPATRVRVTYTNFMNSISEVKKVANDKL